jgi:N-acetylmuramoyl-L-alanine amidase
MLKIVLCAGHGPETAGKRTPDGMREYQFNSAVAYYVRESLLDYEDVAVKFVHSGNRDVPLDERTDRANSWGADAYVSIHANAYGSGGWNSANGIETYVHTSKPKEALSLAQKVQSNLIKETGLSDRGVKATNFQVLRETAMTAILVECGFMTNREEAALLKTNAYRKNCAKAIVEGLVEQYGLKKKPKPQDYVHRLIVDGKQVIALKNDDNLLNEIGKHLGEAKKIEIERVK